jgi:Glycosyltransferase sugar-binding region containing DXD motif
MRWLDRRRRRLLLFTLLIVVIYRYFPSPPRWENNRSANRPTPADEQGTKPDFLYHSRFRGDPDTEIEEKLNEALQKIESKALPVARGPVKKIWQTGPDTASERDDECKRWGELNPGWEYKVTLHEAIDLVHPNFYQYLTDDTALYFVESLANVPYLLEIYKSFPFPILRADFLRYLLLWYYGGFYADIDVRAVHPITSCNPLVPLFTERNHNISLVLGIEIDEPYASTHMRKQWHWSRTYGFTQYAMYAPRRFSPFLRRTIVRLIAHAVRHNDATSGIFHGPRYSEEDILEVTGPGMFTDAVLDVLSESLPQNHGLLSASVDADRGVGALPEGDTTQRVTWAPFHRLKRALWVDGSQSGSSRSDAVSDDMGGLLVLPINVWGNGQRHSGAEMFGSKEACVNHLFGRTWKKGWWEFLFG